MRVVQECDAIIVGNQHCQKSAKYFYLYKDSRFLRYCFCEAHRPIRTSTNKRWFESLIELTEDEYEVHKVLSV